MFYGQTGSKEKATKRTKNGEKSKGVKSKTEICSGKTEKKR